MPGRGEIGRSLSIYHPNRFCDELNLRRKPLSRRRLKKIDIEFELEHHRINWAIIDILPMFRRGAPALDAKLSIGARTSRIPRTWGRAGAPFSGGAESQAREMKQRGEKDDF